MRSAHIDAATKQIQTVAGTGRPGSDGDGGPATKARLTVPTASLSPRTAQSGSPIRTITASDESRQHPDIARVSLENECTIVSTRRANVDMRLASRENEIGLGDSQLLVPPFEPHPWLRGGHSQTIVGRYLGGSRQRLVGSPREVPLADGDRLVIRESVPSRWEPPRPTALLVHGLAGSADASYVVRVGRRLSALGVRVVRVNLRGAGEGFGLARGIYHAGRSDDLRQVVDDLEGTHTRLADHPDRLLFGCKPGPQAGGRGRCRAAPRPRLRPGRQSANRSGWLCETDAPS